MNFDNIVNRLGTYSTQWDFVQDRFGKEGLLPFTISDMDIQTAPEITKSFQKKISHGIYGYTRWDHGDYKGAIASWYKRRFLTDIQQSWIVYTPGVIYAVVKFLEMVNPQKREVCLFTPCYDGFIKILEANNLPMNTIHMADGGINWDTVDKQLQNSSVLLLCNPNNPNGHLWSEDELKTIVELCKKHNVFIISDDIHMDFVYTPNQFIPVLKVAQQLDYANQCVIVTSSSKTFNLSGLGGAYAICPNEDLKKAYVTTLKEKDSLGSAFVLHVDSVITGYNESSAWVDQLCEYIHKNLQVVNKFFMDNPSLNMKAEVPNSTYFSWIDCTQTGLSMDSIQDKLVNKGLVAIMDGDRYKEPLPFLRMNVGCPTSKVEDGLNRVKQSFII